MRVVQTLVVRDEEDIVASQIAYHLQAGVDFVIATDHESVDGTTDILRSFEQQGVLRLIRAQGEVREAEWRTAMARLAAAEYGADWVIPSDADEFWMPRQGTLKEALALVPERFAVVGGALRHFLPRPEDGRPLLERMTVCLSAHASVNDPTSPWRPGFKVVHKGDPKISVGHAGYLSPSAGLPHLPGWNLLDLLHFPCRSREQWERKTTRRGHAGADKPLGIYRKGLQAAIEGRMGDLYDSLVLDDEELAAGLALGYLVEDTRLRDALRRMGGGREPGSEHAPSSASRERIELAVSRSVVYEGELVRSQRQADDVARRVAWLEGRSRLEARKLPSERKNPLVVMTVAYRGEQDLLDAHLAYHLSVGVDHVVAAGMVPRSSLLVETFVRQGRLTIAEGLSVEDMPFETLRARLRQIAAEERSADWIIESDADQFWWPRDVGLKELLAPVPERYTVVQALARVFLPRPEEGSPSFFAERLTVRPTLLAPQVDPEPLEWALRPVYRARGGVVLGLDPARRVPLRAWYPIEVLEFPLRSRAQAEALAADRDRPPRSRLEAALKEAGRAGADSLYAELVVDDERLALGLGDGSLVVDERLRDALRRLASDLGTRGEPVFPASAPPSLALPPPTVVEEAAYAVECACLGEVDLARLDRRLVALEQRVGALEASLWLRARRKLARLVRRQTARSPSLRCDR